MLVGVLGGGLQGCCIALALAERKVRVTLFDKNDALLSRAAAANEGKIHLGYMYAGDPTLSTAKTMMAGALSFAPFLERYLSRPAGSFSVSVPATYIVHRDSQRNAEDCCAYLRTVQGISQRSCGRKNRRIFWYLGTPLKALSAAEAEGEFNPAIALAAVTTPEIAVNPVALAQTMRDCVAAHPLIEVCCNHTVIGAKQACGTIIVLTEGLAGPSRHHFDHVVNAL